jgi:hypothetical protein
MDIKEINIWEDIQVEEYLPQVTSWKGKMWLSANGSNVIKADSKENEKKTITNCIREQE